MRELDLTNWQLPKRDLRQPITIVSCVCGMRFPGIRWEWDFIALKVQKNRKKSGFLLIKEGNSVDGMAIRIIWLIGKIMAKK